MRKPVKNHISQVSFVLFWAGVATAALTVVFALIVAGALGEEVLAEIARFQALITGGYGTVAAIAAAAIVYASARLPGETAEKMQEYEVKRDQIAAAIILHQALQQLLADMVSQDAEGETLIPEELSDFEFLKTQDIGINTLLLELHSAIGELRTFQRKNNKDLVVDLEGHALHAGRVVALISILVRKLKLSVGPLDDKVDEYAREFADKLAAHFRVDENEGGSAP